MSLANHTGDNLRCVTSELSSGRITIYLLLTQIMILIQYMHTVCMSLVICQGDVVGIVADGRLEKILFIEDFFFI